MKIGLVEFGNGIIMEDGLTVSPAMNVHTLSTDLESVKTALVDMVQKKGFTNMAQAFALAESMYTSAGRQGAQPALMVITDGKPSFQFQTNELVEQLDDKGVQRFFVVVTSDNKAIKLMRTWASAPWETNLLHVPGHEVLAADEEMWSQKALTLFCPMAFSPSLAVVHESSAGYLHVMDNKYCGTRGVELWNEVADAADCATRAAGAGCHSFMLGTWFRRGYCWCGDVQVDEAQYETIETSLANPACPDGSAPTDSSIIDFYVLTPAIGDAAAPAVEAEAEAESD